MGLALRRVMLHCPGFAGILSSSDGALNPPDLHRKSFTAALSVATLKFMEAEVSLSCEGIQRYLGEEDSRVHALRGVSLQLERGTVHAAVGPSGAHRKCPMRS